MNPFRRLFRQRRYNDLSVSIQEHIAERTDELIAEGMPREHAEPAARREFGNLGLIEQRGREAWQWPALDSILADLKFIFRRLRKSPGFALTVLLTLAIGIGANTTVFSVLNGVILKPLPYPDSDRIVSLWLNAPGGGLANFSNGLQLSPSMYLTFARHNHSFETIGIWTTQNANVTGLAQPEEVHTAVLSDGILQTLQVPATLGRWFSTADQDPHGAKSVMLSYGYWQRHFGGDRSVIGRSLQVDYQTRQIIGIMPRGFRMVDHDFDLLIPMALDQNNQKLAPFGYEGISRLKPGVTLPQADADLARLIPVWMDSWSNGPGTNSHYYEIWRISPNFRLLKEQVIGNIRGVLWIVMAPIGLVMVIACINIANLLLVRAEARQQELSIRAALGAGRRRIASELLLESVVLGLMGGLLAVGVALEGLRLLVAVGPANLPRLSELSLDTRSLEFTLLLSVLSGLLFGAIPALKYARSTSTAAAGGATRTASAGRALLRSRNLLVIAQVATAMVLLVSALLMIRTFAALRNVEPGFANPESLQTFRVSIPETLIRDPQTVTRTENEIADKLAAIPGVQSVGFALAFPMEGFDGNWDLIAVEGQRYEGGEPPLYVYDFVSPNYFKTMGTHLVAGRDFTWRDIYGLHGYVMVSENFAREFWGSAAGAIGKRVRQYRDSPWLEVIGVVQDVHMHGVDEKAPAVIYWPTMVEYPAKPQPIVNSARTVRFVVQSPRAGTEVFVDQVQQAVWSINGSLPLASIQTMQQMYTLSLARTSFTLVMLAIAGSMALTLGILGIYGVISYTVSQRTREIGIRLALGAQKGDLKWMFVRSALVLTGIGVALGLCGAAALTQSMKTLLFGISPLDPLTYAAIPLVLLVSAVVASYLPARRAASIDPVEALRAE